MPVPLLTRSDLTVFAAKSDAQEALCRKLAASTRLAFYTVFADRHAAKATRKRFLASRAPLTVDIEAEVK